MLLTADRRAGKPMADVFPQFAPYTLPMLTSLDDADWPALGLDLVFCALPHGTTQKVIKDLLARAPATKVVDLSADFRLADPAAYERWYGHRARGAGTAKAGGLRPDRNLSDTRSRRRSWSPIPAATRAARELALIPLLKAKAIDPDEIVIDAKSGMTGAGRAAKEEMLFSEVSEGFHAYGVGHHRHMAELDQEFSLAAGREVVVTFTPHLVPMNRGILSTIYVRGLKGIAARPSCATFKVLRERAVRPRAAVRRAAADAPRARLQHDLHRRRRRPHSPAAPSSARRSIISTKGASGQAVQNMNLMLGFPETMGLEQVALFP